MEKIIFLDRDGVINVDLIGDYVKTWEEFRFEEGAIEAMRELHDLGYQIIIISNQAGIGDGVFSEKDLWDVQGKMLDQLDKHGIEIRDTFYCLHGKKEGCSCRKPEVGLFEKAVEGKTIDRSNTFFIGDKLTDIRAGKKFGLRTIFVRTGHGKFEESKLTTDLKPEYIADNLKSAVQFLRTWEQAKGQKS